MSILESQYHYLILLVFTAFFPIAGSFIQKLQFGSKWRPILIANLVMMFLFIPWDIYFTNKGVWWFNKSYILSIDVMGLPLEEMLFFIIIPSACLFIYESLNHLSDLRISKNASRIILLVVTLVSAAIALFHPSNAYTLSSFGLSALLALILAIRLPYWTSRFIIMYAIVWLPFLLINGSLTGSFTAAAVVNYNPEEFMGIRIFTIPLEDAAYNFSMLLIVLAVYTRISLSMSTTRQSELR